MLLFEVTHSTLITMSVPVLCVQKVSMYVGGACKNLKHFLFHLTANVGVIYGTKILVDHL
jgi:hypothetical protein